MFRKRTDSDRWVEERVLQLACNAMTRDLDWDSLDSGRLHRATSLAKTLTGNSIIVGVLDQARRVSELLADADHDRRNHGLPLETPLWLYVPIAFHAPIDLPPSVVLKRLP